MADIKQCDDLLVLGVHLKSEGYPNTLHRLHDLFASGVFRVTELSMSMWTESTQRVHGRRRLTRNLWRAIVAHIIVAARYLRRPRPPLVYVPYPSVLILFILSCLPRRLRPHYVVADVFISLYDTIVLDRSLIKEDRIWARVLKWMEGRAYHYADRLVVDTKPSARFLGALFDLPEEKIIAIPLSTNEREYKFVPYRPTAGVTHVLFVGTLIPLHGVQTIMEAACILRERDDIRFRIIGDGHDASLVEDGIRKHKLHLSWERSWQQPAQISQEIALADICLGIFGHGKKTQRVCPFKIYSYARVGRPIITSATEWADEAAAELDFEPFASVPPGDAIALARKIVELSDNPDLRRKLASNSQRFYSDKLENDLALESLLKCLRRG